MGRSVTILGLVFAAAIAACGGSAGTDGSAPSTLASVDPNAPGLTDTAWSVLRIGGIATDPGARPTMHFVGTDVVSGTTGCNTYSAGYTVDAATISISHLSSTMMSCPGSIGPQEIAFVAAFQSANGWSIGPQGHLILTGTADIVAAPGP